MKLIYAIVSDDDSSVVSRQLTKNGFFATKLASTGGFLMSGNTTFMICTDDEKVPRPSTSSNKTAKRENKWSRRPIHTALVPILSSRWK